MFVFANVVDDDGGVESVSGSGGGDGGGCGFEAVDGSDADYVESEDVVDARCGAVSEVGVEVCVVCDAWSVAGGVDEEGCVFCVECGGGRGGGRGEVGNDGGGGRRGGEEAVGGGGGERGECV